jgi:hypothetical protein
MGIARGIGIANKHPFGKIFGIDCENRLHRKIIEIYNENPEFF